MPPRLQNDNGHRGGEAGVARCRGRRRPSSSEAKHCRLDRELLPGCWQSTILLNILDDQHFLIPALGDLVLRTLMCVSERTENGGGARQKRDDDSGEANDDGVDDD